MGSEEEQFGQIVNTFLSTDNDIRAQAEASYDGISADKKIFYLLRLLRNGDLPEELRQLCAVLLRRLFTQHFEFAWNLLSQESQKHVKDEVTALVSRDAERIPMRKKICEMAAELIRNLIDENGNNTWGEFLQYLFQLVNSPSVALKENALLIFSAVPGIFGNQQANYLDYIKQMLGQALQSEESSVRFHGGQALSSFILDNEREEAVQKHFSDLAPGYLKLMQESVMRQENDEIMKMAIEMISLSTKFFRPYFGELLNLCLQIGKNTEIDEEWRHLALECCVTAAEAVPGAVKKIGGDVIPMIVQLMLEMMTELEEEDDWNTSDEPCEDDGDDNAAVAESSLDRLACSLGGKFILPIVMSQVQTMLLSPSWQSRYAGLMAVSAVGEGCLKQMEPMLPQIVEPILGFLRDTNPRVRYAACNALGQMATDFAPNYEKKFHSKVLPGLIYLLDDYSCPRVQGHAGAALVNFCEECPKDILKMYSDALLAKLDSCFQEKLKELAQSNKKLVLEQLVTTVASIANTLETDFAPYYERFMPCLKFIMQHANATELRLLRGKTIECASLIGLAVGPDQFTKDAADIMDLLLRTQVDNGGVHIADDDPQLSYMITAWARICQILGDRFAPYLPMVMAPVLRTAAVKPELTMLDSEDTEDIKGAEDWELISLGDSQTVGLHTARLEDKSMACQMLVCYARVMKTHFRPFVDEVLKIILPLFKFYFHDSVRASAAEIVPHLLRCLEGDVPGQVMLWNHIKNELFAATEGEGEAEVKSEQLFAMAGAVEILPREAFDQETIQKMTTIVEKVFTEHFERSAERAETRKDEDFDEVVEEQLWEEMEEDNFLLTKAADITHAFLKVHGEGYLPYLEPAVLGLVTKLVAPDRHWQERQWGICVWDDILEFTGPAAVKYSQVFVPHMLEYVTDSSPEVRQAAAYGCGLMAQFGGAAFTETCNQALSLLVRVVSAPDSREEENLNATENAISAAGKIIKYCPNSVNANEAIPVWLSWLPIWEDKDEMGSVYGFFCELLESDSPAAIGNQGSHLPLIVRIIADTFHRKAIPEESPLRPRMIQLLHKIRGNAELYQYCVNQLSPELQQTLAQSF